LQKYVPYYQFNGCTEFKYMNQEMRHSYLLLQFNSHTIPTTCITTYDYRRLDFPQPWEMHLT